MIVRQYFCPAIALLITAALILSAASPAAALGGDSIADRIGAALAGNDAAGLSALLAPDFVDQSEDFLGDGGLLRQLNEFAAAMPDAQVEISVSKENDGVIAINRTIHGVAETDLMGTPPRPCRCVLRLWTSSQLKTA